eukprot:6211896-Pleurochrysis_carterae.AAC.2
MFDIDYLGEVNNPDGLPGLYDQVPRMYRRVTRRQPPGGERGRELRSTVVSSQFTTLFSIPPYGRRLKGLCARDPGGVGGHQRVAGCLK